MSDPKRFNPIEWFFSACITVLFGVLALTLAVRLIEHIWIWLLVGVLAVVGILLCITLWRRRQPW